MPVVRQAILAASVLGALAGCGASTEPTTNPVPTVTSVTGVAAVAGDTLVITVNGTGYVRASVVSVNDRPADTRYVNTRRLEARLFIGGAREVTVAVVVTNPAPGGGASDNRVLSWTTAPTPVPTVTSLSPAFAMVGEDSVVVRLTGSGFVKESVAYLQDFLIGNLALRVLSPTSATAIVRRPVLASQRAVSLVVFNPAPGGGESAPVKFEVRAPVPVLTALRQTSEVLGGASLALTVDGTGLMDSSVVQVNGTARATRRTGPGTLEATLSSADLADPGTLQITIATAGPGGGVSAALPFTVTAGVPALTVLPLRGGTALPQFPLAVHGQRFSRTSVMRWNGIDLPTTYQSGRRLLASVPAALASATGTASISVVTPGAGGGSSSSLPFTVRPFTAGPATSTSFSIRAQDLTYSDVTGTVFATVSAFDATYPDRLIEIDPNTFAVLRTVAIGTSLSAIAASDDGRLLYIGVNDQNAVRRVDATTLGPWLNLPLGTDTTFGGPVATNIAVIPGQPRSIVVSRRTRSPLGAPLGSVVFDDAVPRASAGTPGASGARLAFAGNDTLLYSYFASNGGSFSLYRHRVDASGLTQLGSVATIASTLWTAMGAGERIYGSDGTILDGESLAQVGFFARGASAVYADATLGRGYAMFSRRIEVFDLNSLVSLASVDVPQATAGPLALGPIARMVRCGSQCLAWTDNVRIVIARSSSFGP